MDTNRISLSAIGAAPVVEPIYVQIGEATVEVRPSISYGEILEMMQWCIDMIVGEKPFLSAPLTRIVKDFAILGYYTNLDSTLMNGGAENMEAIYAEYDIIKKSGVMENVLPKLNTDEIRFFEETLDKTMESIINYRNSAKGIVDTLAADAKDDSSKMQEALDFLSDEGTRKQVETIIEAAEAISG